MIPPAPASCHRQSQRLFILNLLPAVACVLLLLTGHGMAAAAVFLLTFTIIAVGTITPRCALFGPFISALPPGSQGVCLSIDDGPDPETTLRLLDLLDQHQAKAIFFLIGDRAARHPDLVRQIAQRGHLIGNHTQTHPAATFWVLPPQRMWAEVAGCQQTLTSILGTAPEWFRPPVGHHNLFLAPPLRALSLTMLMWDCRGFDGVERAVAVVLRSIKKDLRPGAIILLHDVTPICAEVLSGTLDLLQQRGLSTQLPLKP